MPSENELVESFGISRMTANRALRELTSPRAISSACRASAPSCKEPPARSSLLELRNIAEEIAQRGHRYSARVTSRKEVAANPALAEEFETRDLQRLFHIVLRA